MKTFGLTGNTGTGKTSVARILTTAGVAVIDADVLARKVVQRGEPALDEIVATFGEGVIDVDGNLKRKTLGRLVFSDAEALARLNRITHPRIMERTVRELHALMSSGATLCVYDSAILFESGMADSYAEIIVVTATRAQQLERIINRDQLSREDADQRIDAQMPLAEKVKLADYVIDNGGTKAELVPKVEALICWMRATRR